MSLERLLDVFLVSFDVFWKFSGCLLDVFWKSLERVLGVFTLMTETICKK